MGSYFYTHVSHLLGHTDDVISFDTKYYFYYLGIGVHVKLCCLTKATYVTKHKARNVIFQLPPFVKIYIYNNNNNNNNRGSREKLKL